MTKARIRPRRRVLTAESGRILAHVTTVAGTQCAFLRGQNAYMQQRAFVVHAIASAGPRLEELARRDAVVTHGVPISRSIQPLADLLSLWRLWRRLLRIRPDIVTVSTPKAALLGSVAAWLARVPVRVFLFRGSITEGATGLRRALFRAAERLTAALCHQVICVAPSLLDFARREGIVPPDKGLVAANGMSNGIDAARFDPYRDDIQARARELRHELDLPPGVRVIGYVGALAGDKGIDDLVTAWQSVRETHPSCHLILVGPWEAGDPVAPETRRVLETDQRVHLAGRVEDIVPYYDLMDVLAFASRREGFPNVPMEAAAMEVPVVATSVVGCVDAVLDGVTGTLVPPRDPTALAVAIRRYLDDAELRRRHGKAGRERVVRDFAPEPIWRALYEEYCRLLREKGLPEPRPLGDLPQGEAMVGVQKGDPA